MKNYMKSNAFATILIFALGLFSTSCNDPKGAVERDSLADATEDTAVVYNDANGRMSADGVEIKTIDEGFWQNVDINAPVVTDTRLKSSGVEKRKGEGFSAYTMDDRVLFDLDKSTLKAGAEDKLKEIAASINEEHPNGHVRIYGHTDSLGSAAYNEQLARERANTVKDWLQKNANMDASRLSIHAVGQADPRATNETAAGRQKNRRVAIVVADSKQQAKQHHQEQ